MSTARDYLAAVQQRADAATDGRWVVRPDGFLTCVETWPGEDPIVEGGKVADHEFIAASRTDVPRLVAALTAALDLAERFDRYGWDITTPRLRAVITDALTPKENDS